MYKIALWNGKYCVIEFTIITKVVFEDRTSSNFFCDNYLQQYFQNNSESFCQIDSDK